MKTILMKEFAPLNSHQVGIKIQNKIIEFIEQSDEIVILDFDNINICTDSFSQQITTILANKITYKILKERVKFKNLNDFLKELIKSNLIKASKL